MNTEIEREAAIEKLRGLIAPRATIYVLLRHKNSLGTWRWLEFYLVHDGELRCITYDLSLAIQGEYCRKHDALKFEGAGLDAGYATVDTLSGVLFGTGRALKHRWL